jgi:hypothetical protein
VSPLERRYRLLLHLLPADHRAARGDELLGILLDLDGHRNWPTIRQALGVFTLAMRLRLAGPATMLLTASLVAVCTSSSPYLYSVMTSSIVIINPPPAAVVAVLAMPSLLPLGIAVAWILGARRTALAIAGALLASQLISLHALAPVLLDLALLAVLTAAVRWRWPAPRPRIALLATVPLAILLWVLGAAWGQQHSISYSAGHPHLAWAPAAAGAITGAVSAGVLTRRRSHRAALTLIATGAATGAIMAIASAWLLYANLNSLLPIITLTVALAGTLIRTLSGPLDSPPTDQVIGNHQQPNPTTTGQT